MYDSGTGRTERFIPTCVGNIPPAITENTNITVHPHVCGEHFLDGALQPHDFGSSPRVWGTFVITRQRQTVLRFIPTCVGNINFFFLDMNYSPVHPHVCGEHSYALMEKPSHIGSSPRVWGTFCLHYFSISKYRFIPTCVGNMHYCRMLPCGPSVHPHVCGEH